MAKKYAKDKTRSITLRVSDEQHAEIRANALASGTTSISDYMRNAALTKPPDLVQQFADVAERIQQRLKEPEGK